jgi:hypothetical protein
VAHLWSILPANGVGRYRAHRRAPHGDTQVGTAHSYRRLVGAGDDVRDGCSQQGKAQVRTVRDIRAAYGFSDLQFFLDLY